MVINKKILKFKTEQYETDKRGFNYNDTKFYKEYIGDCDSFFIKESIENSIEVTLSTYKDKVTTVIFKGMLKDIAQINNHQDILEIDYETMFLNELTWLFFRNIIPNSIVHVDIYKIIKIKEPVN